MKIEITDTSKVAFDGLPKRGSIYDPVIEAMKRLKPGKAILLPITKGMDKRVALNRINSALHIKAPTPPKGCVWRKGYAEGGTKIAIRALPIKTKAAVKKTKPKTKAKKKAPAKRKKPPAKKKVRKR